MKKQSTSKKKLSFGAFFRIIKNTFKGFSDDNVPRLSASLAYATLFAMIPFLSLLMTIGTFVHVDILKELYAHLQPVVGSDVVNQIKSTIHSAGKSEFSSIAGLISLGVMIFGATAIFAEIQGSLNEIWGIKAIPRKGWLKYLRTRLLSFSIILIFAFIMLITFTITNVIGNLGDRIMQNFPDAAKSLVKVISFLVNFGLTIFIFVLMFRVLPDAKIKSKDVLIGALVTTILFMIGQLGIAFYIGAAEVGTAYGTAAFMIILITWIYYSAMIIYVGAEFTQAWANEMGGSIFPDEFAVTTKLVEIHTKKPLETEDKKIEITQAKKPVEHYKK